MQLLVKVFLNRHGVAVLLSVLFLGITFVSWKMLQFQHRLHDYIDNPRWEQTLREQGAFADPPILLFGDSDVELWWLAPAFGSLPILNRGVGGQQAKDALPRLQRELTAHKPRLVVLLMGSNDLASGRSPARVAADMENLVDAANRAGANVVLCSLLPVGQQVVKRIPVDRILNTNAALGGLAQRKSIPIVDLYTPLADARGEFRHEFTVDGFHANTKGYFRMTRQLAPHLVPPSVPVTSSFPR